MPPPATIDTTLFAEGWAVPTRETEPTVRLSPEKEAELLEALDEADREEGISAEELFEQLRRHG